MSLRVDQASERINYQEFVLVGQNWPLRTADKLTTSCADCLEILGACPGL